MARRVEIFPMEISAAIAGADGLQNIAGRSIDEPACGRKGLEALARFNAPGRPAFPLCGIGTNSAAREATQVLPHPLPMSRDTRRPPLAPLLVLINLPFVQLRIALNM